MTKKRTMTNNETRDAAIGVGVGVAAAAAAAAAAGAYWLYGAKHSAKHRKMAKAWMLSARAEVMQAVEKLEEVDKAAYMRIVETVVKNYGKSASPEEIAQMMRDFKVAWSHMQGPKKGAKKTGKRAVKRAKRAVSKNRK